MNEPFTDAEVIALAQAFPPGPAASGLLAEAGVPSQHIPTALGGLTSNDFWRLVSEAIKAGLIENGRRHILEAAARRFPANPAFQGKERTRRVLFIGSSPDWMDVLRADRELREIVRRSDPARIEVHYRPAADVSDLQMILTVRPDILHLACHGGEGRIYFEDAAGRRQPLSGADLAETLRLYAEEAGATLRGVVLAACHSAAVAELLLPYASTVIAHAGDFYDDCAIAFSGELYRVLPTAGSLGAAARIAARHVASSRPLCGDLPQTLVVLDRGRQDPDENAA